MEDEQKIPTYALVSHKTIPEMYSLKQMSQAELINKLLLQERTFIIWKIEITF
jgi:hypothetical protein